MLIRPARLAPVGDAGLIIEFEAEISQGVNSKVQAVSNVLRDAAWPELTGLVPSYRSVLVHYDPLATSYDELCQKISHLELKEYDQRQKRKRWEVPVCYGPDFGADFEHLAQRLNLSSREVIELHSSVDYMVYMIGFSPGFAYLGELPPQLEIARKLTPVANVPANAIQIGGRQTAVSSVSMPSGWYVVGQTPLIMFSATRPGPFLLNAGDMVRFRPVTETEFHQISQDISTGSYKLAGDYT
jgi:KipI family sensor histidine kinase inhibitor